MVMTYFLTMLFYYYINGVGALAVNARKPRTEVETIESFFLAGEWPVILIQTIYLIHLYSVFPQFVLAAKYLSSDSGRDCLSFWDKTSPNQKQLTPLKQYSLLS